MEITINRQVILKTVGVWFVILMALSAVFTLIISIGLSMPLGRLFLAILITTFFLWVPPVMVGYLIGYRLRHEKLSTIITRTILLNTVTVTAGWAVSYLLVQKQLQLIPNFSLHDSLLKLYIPSLIINPIVSTITPAIEMIRREKDKLKCDIVKMSSAIENLEANFITLKIEGSIYRIAHKDIIYLCPTGKKPLSIPKRWIMKSPWSSRKWTRPCRPDNFCAC